MIIWLPIVSINPFDATHVRQDNPPGFRAFGDKATEHLDGAHHCRAIIERGGRIRPIAVCYVRLTPMEFRDSSRRWQRMDGFKRYWGHKLAGRELIACVVFDRYIAGPQHGESMEVTEDEWARLSTS